MLKFKTKTEFSIPVERGVKKGIVYLIIDNIEADNNNIKAQGYYYHINEDGTIVKLSNFGANAGMLWETLEYLEENILTEFEDTNHLKSNLMQRITECAFLQIDKEALENYGTVASDWEILNE